MNIGFPRGGSRPPVGKLEPNSNKNPLQLGRIFDFISIWILDPIGLDFGWVLGAKMESESELKISSMNI